MDKMDSFNILPEAEYNVAKTLYQMGISLGCKIVFKKRAISNQPKSYRVVFNKQKNNKVLFWMEISDNTLLVKADLPLHIADDYADKISACSAKIKKSITTVKECVKCSPTGCGGSHLVYHVDNIKYMPCCLSGHYFSKMDENDWNLLRELIVLKNDIA
jgi:hypothetical protein